MIRAARRILSAGVGRKPLRSNVSANVYILLFRGVGGPVQLPTKPLREALAAAGFENVGTYINSGNAYLRTARPRDEVLAKVGEICKARFGYDRAIYAPDLADWRDVVRRNPFEGGFTEGRFLHAAWLGARPDEKHVAALKALAVAGEGIEVVGNVAYLNTPGGLSKSVLGTKFDKGLGVPNTARNWNTVLKLLELAEAAAKA
jgi:uncharacterized protein (DUF1697 family)